MTIVIESRVKIFQGAIEYGIGEATSIQTSRDFYGRYRPI
jgi:hypothetical protein